mmetsp:Transcript_16760/g.19312  ORF Transcript_16760/g.19312 Transcript_16760/m.19312 type:complete len:197 (+) Transcript_16760:686-1276(+)
MCNQTEPNEAALALDLPRTKEGESSEQRLMRLQLRQRYIAAMSMGISPVKFSKKLLRIWGGSLLSEKVTVMYLPYGSNNEKKEDSKSKSAIEEEPKKIDEMEERKKDKHSHSTNNRKNQQIMDYTVLEQGRKKGLKDTNISHCISSRISRDIKMEEGSLQSSDKVILPWCVSTPPKFGNSKAMSSFKTAEECTFEI